MAFTNGPNRGVETDIFVTGPDLAGGTAIAPNAGVDESPSLSPDGTRVAWMSDRGGSRSIWVANVDGSGTPLKLTNINGAGNPEWSPDSTKLAYEVPDNTTGLTQITVRSADGSGGPLVLTGGRANREPTWSPDGKEIAWMRAGDGGFGFDVWVMNASDGTGKRQLTGTGNARGPSWSPDGKFVAFHLDRTVRVISKDEVAGFGTPLRIPDNTVSEVNRAAAWQTLPTFPECLDSDGDDDSDDDDDALCDNWEETGLDWDRDGTVDLTLPGAQREHRDLYVELDHMADHFPGPNAINDVVAAFANAPATPAANAGITLHVEVGNAMPESASIAFPGCTGAAGGGDADFDTLKSANFGTPAQRSAGVAVLGAKRYAYRYGVYAHTLLGRADQSGCSELPGNDFIVTLGSGARVVAGGHRVGLAQPAVRDAHARVRSHARPAPRRQHGRQLQAQLPERHELHPAVRRRPDRRPSARLLADGGRHAGRAVARRTGRHRRTRRKPVRPSRLPDHGVLRDGAGRLEQRRRHR